MRQEVLGGPRSLVVLGPFDDDAFPDWDGRANRSLSQVLRVGVFGAAGRMGAAVCEAVGADPELELVAVVDPAHAGEKSGACRPRRRHSGPEAMAEAGAEVAVDFTVAAAAQANAVWCADNGVHAVIGTTGFSPAVLAEMKARFEAGVANCVVAPNFAIGAVLMMRFAELAAPFFETVEIVELHHDGKVDCSLRHGDVDGAAHIRGPERSCRKKPRGPVRRARRPARAQERRAAQKRPAGQKRRRVSRSIRFACGAWSPTRRSSSARRARP